MKKECYLIQDVLLLYRENLCSEETKEVVEEHLAVCEECSQCYKDMENSDIVEDMIYDEGREKEKANSLKKVKKRVIRFVVICGIVWAIIISVPTVMLLYISISNAMMPMEVTMDISCYEQVFGENAKEVYQNKCGMDDSIFPDEITEEMEIRDFKMIYDPSGGYAYLGYLIVQYEDEFYEKELIRLKNYNPKSERPPHAEEQNKPYEYDKLINYVGIYGVQGFREELELININAGHNGFVYALTDNQNQIIYVELIFSEGHCSIDYEEHIDTKYLPIGLNIEKQ